MIGRLKGVPLDPQAQLRALLVSAQLSDYSK
jgi:hypothetical protein